MVIKINYKQYRKLVKKSIEPFPDDVWERERAWAITQAIQYFAGKKYYNKSFIKKLLSD